MVEIRPTDGAAQFAMRLREIERRLAGLETMRRTPYTDIYDADGNLLGKLSAEGLAFFNVDGERISSLDGSGLTVFDESGTAQLRAGDLDGLGDYGVEIGGGRARAMDMDTGGETVSDVPITTVPTTKVSTTFTPPSWATDTLIWAALNFQMHNSSGGVQRQYYRIDVAGQPGAGLWTNYVQDGLTANVTDNQGVVWPGNSPILVEGLAAVDVGTNNSNDLRLHVMVVYLR